MVQSTSRLAHDGVCRAHRRVGDYPKKALGGVKLPYQTSDSLTAHPKEDPHPFETRFLAMGLSPETAKIVGAKLSVLAVEQRRKVQAEISAASQFRFMDIKGIVSKLTPVQRKTKHQKLIAFDLDETLVHSSFDVTDADHIIRFPTEDGEIREIGVRVRPHAVSVLQDLSSFFEIAVFTASIESYARPVLDLLDPTHTLIQHRLYRDSCVPVGPFLFKDLRVFRDFGLKDVLLIDNSAFGFAFQRENGVPVNSWVEDEKDEELKIVAEYLKLFKTIADFEPSDIELALPDPNPRVPLRDADGFADVSLDSHSEPTPGDALETHPVFLMNSVIIQSPVKLFKQRSITVSGPPRGGRTLDEAMRDEALQSELALRSNPRSISYSSVSVGGDLVVGSVVCAATEAIRSTRASAASSFHEGHEAAKKLD